MLLRNCVIAVGLAAASLGVAQAQSGDPGLPPMPLAMLEKQGELQRVDVARSLVWISGAAYKLGKNARAYVGSRPLTDLRDLQLGARVGFMDDGQGNLTTFWAQQASHGSEENR